MKKYEIKAEYINPKDQRDALVRRFTIEVENNTEDEIIEAIAEATDGPWCDMEFNALYPIEGLTRAEELL